MAQSLTEQLTKLPGRTASAAATSAVCRPESRSSTASTVRLASMSCGGGGLTFRWEMNRIRFRRRISIAAKQDTCDLVNRN